MVRIPCYIYGLLIIALTAIAGCSKKLDTPTLQNFQAKGSTTPVEPLAFSEQNLIEHIKQAQLIDTPVPINFNLLAQEKENNNEYLMYQGSYMPLQSIQTFYLHEMERLGWNIFDLSNKQEGMIFCQKPTKQCILSIRPHINDIVYIHMFITSIPPTPIEQHNDPHHIARKVPYLDAFYS